MNKFTLGVAANEDGIVLIKKTKPAWQAGLFNFVGGKVEEGESFPKCMVREFREETGVVTKTSDWKYVGKMFRKGEWIVKIYATSKPAILQAKTSTEEEVHIVNPDKFLVDTSLQLSFMTNILTIYNFTSSLDFISNNATLNIEYK